MRVLLTLVFLYFGLWGVFGSVLSEASNSGITYHGRLLKPDGTPVVSSNVQFKIQIRTPGVQDCLMYEEIQTKNLSQSSGVFSVSIGDSSGVRQDTHSWTLFDTLSNRRSFTFSSGDCAGSTTYTPNPEDNRIFRVYFKDGTLSSWEALPLQAINYIPLAVESYRVGGFPASSLFRVEDSGTLGNVSALTTTQYNNLVDLADGISSAYEKSGELGGSALPSLTSGQAVVSDGSGGWTAMSPLTSESDPNVSAFAKTSLPTCGTGEVLKSDGTQLTCVTDSGGWSAMDATTTTKGIVSVPVAGGLEVSSGAIGLPDQTLTPGSFTKVTVNQKGIVTNGSQITGSDLTSGTIGGSTSMLTTGDVTADQLSAHGLYLSNLEPKTISILPPASISANYTLTLPSSLGSANQILGMNNAGNALENKSLIQGTGVTITHSAGGITISATGSGGTVTSVSGTTPISVATGTSTPVISLDDSGVTANTYGSATQVPVFAVNSKGLITSVTNTTISGVSPVGSTLSTGKAWLGDGMGKAAESYINVSDLKKSDGTNQIPTTCSASQTLTWSSLTDVFTCSNISISNTQVSGLTAGNISSTAAGSLSSTDVQAALEELDSDLSGKISKSGDTMSGNLNMNSHQILNISNVPFASANPTGAEDGKTLRWNNTSENWEWFSPGVAGSGVTSINGETGNSQSLTIGTSGNSPAWSSSTNTHTLNIPMASATGVTAGLISKSDYDNFNSKLSVVAGSSLTSKNIWVGNSSNQAQAVSLSGDATLSNVGVLTLKNTGTAGTYGSATEIPVITTDAQGRVTSVTETTITGTSPVGSSLTSGSVWMGDGTNKAAEVVMSGDATLASDGTLTLKDTGTAGTYFKVTTDVQGRVTSGSNPTTLSGFGITDGVKNNGGTISLESGLDASKPSAGTAGQVYLATDTQKIYRDNGTSWDLIASASGAGGTVTSVSGTSPIQVATGTSTPVISVDDASTTAKGVVTLATDGETTAGEVVQANDSRLSSIAGKLDDTLAMGKVFVGNASNKAAAQWLGVADLKTSLGSQQWPSTSCSTGQTLTWSSITDALSCSNISITSAQVSGLTASNVTNTPAGTIAATSVQAAVNELDSEKVAKSGDTMTGLLTVPLLRRTPAALPGTPVTGDIAIDSNDSNTLKWYNGSGWQAASVENWSFSAKSSDFTVTSSDSHKIFQVSGTTSATMPAASSVMAGYIVKFVNTGSDTVSINFNGTDLVDGAAEALASLTGRHAVLTLISDGSGWNVFNSSQGVVVGCISHGSQAFTYTGSDQSFTVPAGCLELTVKMWGAGGGGPAGGPGVGGAGGFTSGSLVAVNGETLTVIVGEGGGPGSSAGSSSATYGGGGAAAATSWSGGAGGGRSAIRRSSVELVTAAGGGGSAMGGSNGGAGGGTSGSAGTSSGGGGGGTQASGGAGGGTGGTAGSSFQGGDGGSSSGSSTGGGGGGGYYGGGGGGTNGPSTGGGGGGSSYVGGLSSGSTTAGSGATPPSTGDSDYQAGVAVGGSNNTTGGDGLVVISW